MALRFGEPPSASIRELADALPRFAAAAVGVASLHVTVVQSLAAAKATAPLFPHQVFAIELRDVRDGRGVEAARLVAWRFVIGAESGAPFTADVSPDDGGGYRLEALRSGSSAIATLRDVERLRDDPRVQNRSYEVRLLLFPAGRLRCLWFADAASATAERDLFHPLNDPLQPGQEPQGVLLDYPAMRELLRRVADAVQTKVPDAPNG